MYFFVISTNINPIGVIVFFSRT